MILPFLFIAPTNKMGRGVFTAESIAAGTIIEVAPVIVMGINDRKLLDQTMLHDYIFEWGVDRKMCAVALGYVSIYNHSPAANCEYEMIFDEQQILIKTVRAAEKGEELFINYQGDWNATTAVWFETKN